LPARAFRGDADSPDVAEIIFPFEEFAGDFVAALPRQSVGEQRHLHVFPQGARQKLE